MACDSNNQTDDNLQLPKEEDYAGPKFASDELSRPMKKVRSCADEDYCPEELDNGWFIFYGTDYCVHIVHPRYLQLTRLILIRSHCAGERS